MRAGPHAVVGGEAYRCGPLHAQRIRLLVPRSGSRPAGFEAGKGYWERTVDRTEVSRLFYVDTTAFWRDRSVQVFEVSGDRALIEYRGADFHGGPELILTDYSVWPG